MATIAEVKNLLSTVQFVGGLLTTEEVHSINEVLWNALDRRIEQEDSKEGFGWKNNLAK